MCIYLYHIFRDKALISLLQLSSSLNLIYFAFRIRFLNREHQCVTIEHHDVFIGCFPACKALIQFSFSTAESKSQAECIRRLRVVCSDMMSAAARQMVR
jgi:hypothetical protein